MSPDPLNPGFISLIWAVMELPWDVCPHPHRLCQSGGALLCVRILVPDHRRPGFGVTELWAGGFLQGHSGGGVLGHIAVVEKQRLLLILNAGVFRRSRP